jgi:hypothetical protein
MKKGFLATVSLLAGAAAGAATIGKIQGQAVEAKAKKVDQFRGYYNMLNQWLVLKQEGKSLEKYFVDNGYKKIAIYGMGEMGNRLYDELKGSSVEIKFAIDKEAESIYSDLEVIEKEELTSKESVDVIVVTATYAYDEIEEEISGMVNCPVVSLDDVVYEA